MADSRHRVVIVGGGFGGLYAAQHFRGEPVDVTLIDKRNFHLFQPLLYQVATGGLSPANIAAPLHTVLRRQRNVSVLLGTVTGFDLAARAVLLGDERIPFDSLIVAAGSGNFYFGNSKWEPVAPGLKSIEDATAIRARLLGEFERAEREASLGGSKKDVTFVLVGGGPTGVEMAGAISELSRHTLRNNFRFIDPAKARILVIEGLDRLLPPFPESLSRRAERDLRGMGVEVWTSAKVKDIQADHILVERNGVEERVDTATVIWAAGVAASPLGKALTDAAGTELDRRGRVVVQKNHSIAGHPNIFVIGDLAAGTYPDGKPLPGVAPAAMQQGSYVARLISGRAKGKQAPPPFRYWDKGNMATIGRNAAVVDVYWMRFSGWFAWVTWLFVHITYLVAFENRLLVMLQWFWNYWSRNRSARLITQKKGDGSDPT